MNSNYISTESLFDSGAHLSHARTYSHKYIRREPDGSGGYRYFYNTDSGYTSSGSQHIFKYSREKTRTGKMLTTGKVRGNYRQNHEEPSARSRKSGDLAKKYRQADKASQIYREGQSDTEAEYKAEHDPRKKYRDAITSVKRTARIAKEAVEGAANSVKDVATTTINDITSTAKKTYDSGINFLKEMFK